MLCLLAAFSLWCAASSLECGTWLTNDCLGAGDIRYDPNYPTDLMHQDPRWKNWEGFWSVVATSYGADGRIVQPALPSPSDPYGFPYKSENHRGFYNHTFAGSRFIYHRYFIYPAPDPDFCEKPIPPNATNTYSRGGGRCGEHAVSFAAGGFGASTYEKNGEIKVLRGYGKYQDVLGPFRWVDDTTMMANVGDATHYGAMNVMVWLNDERTVVSGSLSRFTLGANARLDGTVIIEMTRLTEEQFIQSIKDAYSNLTVLPADQVQGGTLPMETAALEDGAYPTEDEWCTVDPACSVSPYQEPPATLKAGIIAGFVTAAAVLVILAIVLFFLHRLKQQRHRYREGLMKRMSEHIEFKGHLNCLGAEDLEKEFKRIDEGVQGGDGYIQKEEMKTFMMSGKAGSISESDFNAMWVALDFDGNGKVDFIEFCTFLSRCAGEYDDVAAEQSRHSQSKTAAAVLSRKGTLQVEDGSAEA